MAPFLAELAISSLIKHRVFPLRERRMVAHGLKGKKSATVPKEICATVSSGVLDHLLLQAPSLTHPSCGVTGLLLIKIITLAEIFDMDGKGELLHCNRHNYCFIS